MGLFDRFKKNNIDDLEVDLSKRNFTYLNHMLKNSGNEFTLDSDIVLDEAEAKHFETGIEIKDRDELTIDGAGHSIDAIGKAGFFVLKKNKATVHFKNIRFKNGFIKKTWRYSCIDCEKNVSVRFTDCTFENSHKVIGISSEGHLSNCTFENNEICFSPSKKIRITSCTFKKNNVITTRDGDFDIEGCTFTENTRILQSGPGCHINICDSTFKTNGPMNVASVDVNFTGCCFRDNKHGAIHVEFPGKCTIRQCKFVRNHCAGNGGAIFNDMNATLKIYDSCFKDNRSERDGGAIFNNIRAKPGWENARGSTAGDGILEFVNQGNTYSGNMHRKYENHEYLDEYEENTVMDPSKNIVF